MLIPVDKEKFDTVWSYLSDNEYLHDETLEDDLMKLFSIRLTEAQALVQSFRERRSHRYCLAICLEFGKLEVEEFDDFEKARDWISNNRGIIIAMQYAEIRSYNLYYAKDGVITRPSPASLAKIRNALWHSKLFPAAFGETVQECFEREIDQNATQQVLEKAKLENKGYELLKSHSKQY